MTVTAVYAEVLVTDISRAESWYAALFGGPPDLRPMDGLLTWLFGEGRGVQVWRDPERAGRSAFTVAVSDLDATAARLRADGLDHGGIEPGGGARLLQLLDPDGNQVVITGT